MPETILLAWNPRKWPWDDFAEQELAVREHGAVDERWGCGNRKRIPVGTRFFLIRLGVPPKGIIASGWTISAPYEHEEEWDANRGARTRPYHLVDITFDKLFAEPPLPLAVLQRAPFANFHWAIQMSGVIISPAIAAALERVWKRRCEAIS